VRAVLKTIAAHFEAERARFEAEAAAKSCERCTIAAEVYANCAADVRNVMAELEAQPALETAGG
jgi:hypothetical protein